MAVKKRGIVEHSEPKIQLKNLKKKNRIKFENQYTGWPKNYVYPTKSQ